MSIIEEWKESLRARNTKLSYMNGLKSFARTIIRGKDNLDSAVEQYVKQIKSGRDLFDDLLAYASSLSESPPKTAQSYMAGTISFFQHTVDLDLTHKQKKLIRNRMPKGKRARTIEDDLTRERLRKILSYCDVKGKTLYLFLESSGIRVGEALQLEVDDLDLSSHPVKVNVRGEYTKSGDPYYSFISTEAKQSLEEWLRMRERYVETSVNRGGGLAKWRRDGRGVKPTEDQRVFPFSISVAIAMWNTALRKAKLENQDKATRRRTLHVHMLRKYFSSQLKLVVPREIVEALMGHEEGLDDAYKRYTEKEIREWYLKGEAQLDIFSAKEYREMKKDYDTKFGYLIEDNIKLRNTVKSLQTQVEDLSQLMDKRIEEITTKLIEKRMEKIIKEHY